MEPNCRETWVIEVTPEELLKEIEARMRALDEKYWHHTMLAATIKKRLEAEGVDTEPLEADAGWVNLDKDSGLDEDKLILHSHKKRWAERDQKVLENWNSFIRRMPSDRKLYLKWDDYAYFFCDQED